MQTFKPHSTRLFPKFQGAAKYRSTGLADRCDLLICSDRNPPQIEERWRKGLTEVKTVFLSLRQPEIALNHFLDVILPKLMGRFVLITGSEDVTLPFQTDKRWRPFPHDLTTRLITFLDDDRLCAWFCENLDAAVHQKIKPLPLGFVFQDHLPTHDVEIPIWTPVERKQKRILCGHRIREGAQWETRKAVTALAETAWSEFTTFVNKPLEEYEFTQLIETHAFVLCVEGGGLDPSPKAWQALLHGSIPIVRQNPTSAAYDVFPVIMLDSWSPSKITSSKVEKWYQDFFISEYLYSRKSQIIDKLSIDYWWNYIYSHVDF